VRIKGRGVIKASGQLGRGLAGREGGEGGGYRVKGRKDELGGGWVCRGKWWGEE